MKNRLVIAWLALPFAAPLALAQGLHPVSDVRTVEAAPAPARAEVPQRAIVEVPTLDRLLPFQRFVIDPTVRQNAPDRFEIRVNGTIRNYARVTNGFVRAQRFVADRLEEARVDWLKDNGHVGGVMTRVGAEAGREQASIQPRAILRMPQGSSGGGGYRVQAPTADRARLVAALERLEQHRTSVQPRPAERPTAVAAR